MVHNKMVQTQAFSDTQPAWGTHDFITKNIATQKSKKNLTQNELWFKEISQLETIADAVIDGSNFISCKKKLTNHLIRVQSLQEIMGFNIPILIDLESKFQNILSMVN